MSETRRIHFQAGAPVASTAFGCGRWAGIGTRRIADVTCKVCLKALWREVSLAHFRAFGAGSTAFGRRIRKAMREAELATRTPA